MTTNKEIKSEIAWCERSAKILGSWGCKKKKKKALARAKYLKLDLKARTQGGSNE